MHYPESAGADEAGRGPLAGPVVAAAVILPGGFDLEGINDSKKLDRDSRERLALRIRRGACYCIQFADVDEIERLNILHASLAAMARAIHCLPEGFSRAYIDGNRLPPGLPCAAEAVVKGDGKIACIAAASILAKTARDAMMVEVAMRYPGYGFEKHFGYPTPEHIAALERLGPCPVHRSSFARVRDGIQPCLTFGD